MTFGGKLIFSLLIIIPIFFLDQVTKARFGTNCNSGIAFGFFRDAAILNIITPGFVIGLCLYFLLKSNMRIVSLGLLLVIAGGVGNFFDRLAFGCVRDFINLGFWPSFNLADSAVTIGILVIIFSILFGKKSWTN